MTVGREQFLHDLLERVEEIVSEIEDRENIEPDFAIIREYAEQLRDELDSLIEE